MAQKETENTTEYFDDKLDLRDIDVPEEELDELIEAQIAERDADPAFFSGDTERNMYLAAACELQRSESKMPFIPVISLVEFDCKTAFFAKMESYFDSDYFFFLKDQEEEFLNRDNRSYFKACLEDSEDSIDAIDEMIDAELKLVSRHDAHIWDEFIRTSEIGDFLYLKRRIPAAADVRGFVEETTADGQTDVRLTDDYLIILQHIDEEEGAPIRICDAFPI